MMDDRPPPDAPDLLPSIVAEDRGEVERVFHHVYDTYLDSLCRYVHAYVDSWETAKDVVNEVFLQIWLRLEAGESIHHLQAYLYATARHRAVDHLRRRRVQTRHLETQLSQQTRADDHIVPAEGEQRVVDRELVAAIQRAVDMLPPRQREVMLLKWQRQATHEEIAQELGIAANTVAEHFRRALERLRVTLADLGGDDLR